MKSPKKIKSFENFVLEQTLPKLAKDLGKEKPDTANPYPKMVKGPNGKNVIRWFSEPSKVEEPEKQKVDLNKPLQNPYEKQWGELGLVGRDATSTKFSPPTTGAGWSPPNPGDPTDPHELMLYATLGSVALPFLGVGSATALAVGTVIGLTDAAIYLLEEDWKMGSAMAFFSLIPYAGKYIAPQLSKIGAKYTPQMFEMSQSAYKSLVQKLASGPAHASKKLTEIEVRFLRNVIKFRKQILGGIDSFLKQKASEVLKNKNVFSKLGNQTQVEVLSILEGMTKGIGYLAKNIYSGVKTSGGFAIKLAKGFLPWIIGFEAYQKAWDWIQDVKGDIDYDVSKEFDWQSAKNVFGSSGSKEDNEKLKKSWERGWRPGDDVPKEFQTSTYVKNLPQKKKEEEDAIKLAELLASE